jgi:hypothetical protein
VRFVLPPSVFVVESFIYVEESGDGDGDGNPIGKTDDGKGVEDGKGECEKEEKEMPKDGDDAPITAVAAGAGP